MRRSKLHYLVKASVTIAFLLSLTLTGCRPARVIVVGTVAPQKMTPVGTQPEASPPAEVRMVFTADRNELQLGECTILRWEVEGGFEVLLGRMGEPGDKVGRSGQTQVCPDGTTTYWLGVDTGEKVEHRFIEITVASAAAPTPTPQLPALTPTPKPPLAPTPTPQLPTLTPTPKPLSAPTPTPQLTPSGGLSADIRPSDIFVDNQPHGTVWVRITNDGPDTLTNKEVEVSGWGFKYLRTTFAKSSELFPTKKVTLNLAPGQTQTINLGWQIDTSLYKYDNVTITVTPKDFVDPNTGNNTYAEAIMPRVPVATPTPTPMLPTPTPTPLPGGGSWKVLTADLEVTQAFVRLVGVNLNIAELYAIVANNGPDTLEREHLQNTVFNCKGKDSTGQILFHSTESLYDNSYTPISPPFKPGMKREIYAGVSVPWGAEISIECTLETLNYKDPNPENNSFISVMVSR